MQEQPAEPVAIPAPSPLPRVPIPKPEEKTPQDIAKFSRFLGKTVDDSVVHHLIERQAGKLSALVDDLLLHAPANLRLIPKGVINSAVHLSDIRKMWNALYRGLTGLSDEAVLAALRHFAAYTDEFIAHMMKAVRAAEQQGKSLTKEMLREIADTWFASRPVDKAVDAALKVAQQVK